MTVYQVPKLSLRQPTHPGELMAEILGEGLGLSTAAAAAKMGVTRQALHRVLSRAGALSPEMALRFAALVGASAGMFLRMQEAHGLWVAQKRLAKQLKAIAAKGGKLKAA